MKNRTYYRFTFADGFYIFAYGFDRIEKQHLEAEHGKLIAKVRCEE